MKPWDAYPIDYRTAEVRAVLEATSVGESVSLVGLSGSGKSNLVGYLYHRCNHQTAEFILIDGNRARPRTAEGLLALILRALSPESSPDLTGDRSTALEHAVEQRLAQSPNNGVCLLLDRYDALEGPEQAAAAGELRALRDAFKYQLSYVTATRRPLDPHSEMAELFYAHTLWLRPLATQDALWAARYYAERTSLILEDAALQSLVAVSWGYPSLLRGCCEAYAQGCPLDEASLRAHPAVTQRVQEFWSDRPTPEEVRRSGLEGQPLLGEWEPGLVLTQGSSPDSTLTALEHRLLTCLKASAGQVCAKDDLIHAVWPEDRVVDGLRDDSLAQLVRRLRQKIEEDPSQPLHILTVPGRGYRYVA